MTRRVAISGMGAISAAGLGLDALWDAAREGRSAIGPIELPNATGNRVLIGGAIPGFDPARHIDETVLRTCDAYSQYALYASAEAIAMAGCRNRTCAATAPQQSSAPVSEESELSMRAAFITTRVTSSIPLPCRRS